MMEKVANVFWYDFCIDWFFLTAPVPKYVIRPLPLGNEAIPAWKSRPNPETL